ncbi:MAE_28990/MAE_18760 family HEPN-like nuclease [Undibacterium sp. TC9W]|uniref:MAE_28990/MAE_18760 family HEPN-like nuclease n=1 Tax=Undibacterium sp. TC9W TaxID=3413053 RepID=UPI003BF2672B
MLKTREVFEERAEEIALYFNFIYEIIDRRAMLSLTPPFSTANPELRDLKHIPSDVIDTLKANGFLLLYNIVEATITRAVQAIYMDIEKHDHHFDELHPLLRKHIASTFRRDDDSYKRIIESTHPISKSIIRAGFEASRLFSGNIHHKTLKEFADKIGFSVDTDGEKTRGGKRLTNVKNRRNELAHGNMSFLACGKITPIEEILEIRNEVISYLEEILDNIEEYLNSKKYLEKNVSVINNTVI